MFYGRLKSVLGLRAITRIACALTSIVLIRHTDYRDCSRASALLLRGVLSRPRPDRLCRQPTPVTASRRVPELPAMLSRKRAQ